MPRRFKRRHCRRLSGIKNFKPSGIPAIELEKTVLRLDEFEAMRLCDHEGKSQIEAAEVMGISRGTVQRLLLSGRKKVLDVLLGTRELIIENSLSITDD